MANGRVAGTYLADEQVVVVNRAQDGVTGVERGDPAADSPTGQLVLVNRGFVADTDPVPAPPSGEVQVTGRLRATRAALASEA